MQEKAKRLQSRHALHDIQMNQIKAAASPMRRQSLLPSNDSPSAPKTPLRRQPAGKENGMFDDDINVGGSAVTPMKRVPILANFEEWMKMATDNKINAANSWNFALIDYFHDMSLLKEGNGVNFQRASVTLDGCVKIYTSRVDSVATETGKLLSGLAESKESKSKKNKDGEEGGAEESEEEVEDEDGVVRKKPKRKAGRSSENTLAPSFASLQLKKMELEFSVDPLFKKASADFDEGGAKGLLLNHLSIDAQGRIVFDSSDDAGDASAEGAQTTRKDAATQDDEAEADASVIEQTKIEDDNDDEDVEIDISALGTRFFPNLDMLEEMHICPTLKDLDMGDASGTMDIPFLKAKEQDNTEVDGGDSGNAYDDDNAPGFDDDDDAGFGGNFEGEAIAGFGEGGEVWAREAAIEPQMRLHTLDEDNPESEDGAGSFDPESGGFIVKLQDKGGKANEGTHEDILSYFDTALQKNWAGPEHWRIRKIKDNDATKDASAPKARKEKEPFEINFSTEMDAKTNDILYTTATTNAAISLPKKDWKSKTRNLLPDDKHFSSKQLLRLFLKPKAQIGSRRTAKSAFGQQTSDNEVPELDEAFWAQKENPITAAEEDVKGDYDANFFQDDGLPMAGGIDDDEDDFVDARDHLSPTPGMDGNVIGNIINGSTVLNGEEGAFGSQLVTQSRRLRPEYVQYARVAKKVDVRRLKEELWKGMEVKGLHSVSLSITRTFFQTTNNATGSIQRPSQIITRRHTRK